MKALFITLITTFIFCSCAQTQNGSTKIPAGNETRPASNEAVATFAEGCFWHTEIVFQSLAGVRDAVSGYAGGSVANPDYEQVGSGETGHAESVQVYYDPSKISFETLVRAFFASHDPTQLNGQGNDLGTQYRSIAFYRSEKEKQVIEAEIKRLKDEKRFSSPIVTEVKKIDKFYPAEDYHQEYILHHPDNPYVKHVSIPDYEKFRREFKGPFKL
jgi:peptide-methionine (S)-S-oxide reductase